MKIKSNLFRSGRLRGRLYYIVLKRKLKRVDDERLIVLLSALIFLMQLLILVTAVTAAPGSLHQDTTGRISSVRIKVHPKAVKTGLPVRCIAVRKGDAGR